MKTIKVWDLFVRIFHWSLVSAVILQLITAENFNSLHVTTGYVIVVLLILRVIWGFLGSRHARFKDFIYPPADIFGYLKDLFRGRAKHYDGHNPAGGAMVCFLLLVLGMVTLTGLLTYGAEGKGPLALKAPGLVKIASADDNKDDDKDHHDHEGAGAKDHFWKEIHESLVSVLIFLACLHIAGVLASSYVHKENLILAMITGYKKFI